MVNKRIVLVPSTEAARLAARQLRKDGGVVVYLIHGGLGSKAKEAHSLSFKQHEGSAIAVADIPLMGSGELDLGPVHELAMLGILDINAPDVIRARSQVSLVPHTEE